MVLHFPAPAIWSVIFKVLHLTFSIAPSPVYAGILAVY